MTLIIPVLLVVPTEEKTGRVQRDWISVHALLEGTYTTYSTTYYVIQETIWTHAGLFDRLDTNNKSI